MVLAASLVIAALLLVNALYVAAEFAAVSVRRSRLHQLKEDGNVLAAWLLPIVESPAALEALLADVRAAANVSTRTTVVLSTPFERRAPSTAHDET